MKNVLVLTGRYLPNMSPNGICIDNIIRKLPKNEYHVTCICYDDHETMQDDRVRIVRVSRGPLKNILYRNEKSNTKASNIIRKIVNLIDTIRDIPFLLSWPWDDPIFTYRVLKRAERLHKESPFDYVIAVHMPISSLIVADKLKKKYPRLTIVPYFLDSLSGGRPISIFSEEWNRKKKLKWEERLLLKADKIVVMEASRAHHEQYSSNKPYYNKFVYLDIPLLMEQERGNEINPFPDRDLINITFSGAALQPMRNLQYFMKLSEAIHRIDNRIVFNIIGQCNCSSQFDIEYINYYEPMPHDQLQPFLEYSDILLNFGVRVPSAISGKIFEYMTFGKPIISTYSIPNEACISYLNRYPNSLLIEESDETIVQTAMIAVDFIHESITKHIELSDIKKTFKKNLPETFIEEVLERKDT